jgi:formylmethanofuran dehydrogenase subunit E
VKATKLEIGSELTNLIEKGAEFHGHLGPFLVLGIRIGLIGLRESGAPRKFGQMKMTAKLKLAVPFSCLIDGIQVVTRCTVGNRMLELEDSKQGMAVDFRLRNSDKALTVHINPEIVRYLMNKFSEGVSNEKLAWKIASLPESQLFMIEKQ